MVMLLNSPTSHNVIKMPFPFLRGKEVKCEKINANKVTIYLRKLELLWSGIYGDALAIKDNSGDSSPPYARVWIDMSTSFNSLDALHGKNFCTKSRGRFDECQSGQECMFKAIWR